VDLNLFISTQFVNHERNGVWVPEDGDVCHKTGKIDR